MPRAWRKACGRIARNTLVEINAWLVEPSNPGPNASIK
jgi:hypothetical protein